VGWKAAFEHTNRLRQLVHSSILSGGFVSGVVVYITGKFGTNCCSVNARC